MSKINRHKQAIDNPLSKDEQKQLLLDAIQKRFPDTNFKEWAYYPLGHLIDFQGGGRSPYKFIEFFTSLLIYIASHKLTDSFLEEVDSNGFEMIEKLIHFFNFISDKEDHYAFARYFMLNLGGFDAQQVVNAANDYLTGENLEKVLAANPDTI